MSAAGDEKIPINVRITSRAERAISAEAKRLGINFSDQVRRIMDNWVDATERARAKPVEKVVVMDHHGILHQTR